MRRMGLVLTLLAVLAVSMVSEVGNAHTVARTCSERTRMTANRICAEAILEDIRAVCYSVSRTIGTVPACDLRATVGGKGSSPDGGGGRISYHAVVRFGPGIGPFYLQSLKGPLYLPVYAIGAPRSGAATWNGTGPKVASESIRTNSVTGPPGGCVAFYGHIDVDAFSEQGEQDLMRCIPDRNCGGVAFSRHRHGVFKRYCVGGEIPSESAASAAGVSG